MKIVIRIWSKRPVGLIKITDQGYRTFRPNPFRPVAWTSGLNGLGLISEKNGIHPQHPKPFFLIKSFERNTVGYSLPKILMKDE